MSRLLVLSMVAALWWNSAVAEPPATGQDQFELGMMYLTGDGIARDDAAAAHWLRLAAEADVAAAQGNLGFLYLEGRGVARDPQQAAAWLRRAADKGIAAAQHNLGWMAQLGVGMAVEPETALRWYGAAAQSGFSPSQYNLGVLLSAGGEVRQDLPAAVKWLSLAGLSPRPEIRREAGLRLVELSRAVSPSVVARGLDEARRWLAEGRVS